MFIEYHAKVHSAEMSDFLQQKRCHRTVGLNHCDINFKTTPLIQEW